jgi:predicted hydrocarbon binding protein
MTASPLHERLAFDTSQGQVLDADRRYVLLRADVLMGLFDLLPGDARDQALAAFAESVFRFGSGSVRAYADPADPGSHKLFAAVAQGAASLGWGVWTFELSDRSCQLTVVNSPFAAASKTPRPACSPILGMLRAVCEHAWKVECVAEEVECCAAAVPQYVGHEGQVCRFRAFPR